MEKGQESNPSNQNRQDRFSQLMFGSPPARQNETQVTPNATVNQNQEIDFVQIMQQLDSIMVSINQLKPMIKQLSPLLDYFKKSK